MKVAELMTKDVCTCSPDDTLSRAAQLMWEHDCGAVPVVDGEGRTVGIVTDRDICMAAYTQGKALSEIPVTVAAARRLVSVRPDAGVDVAEATMQSEQVRRVLVVDENEKLAGVLSVGDLARRLSTRGSVSDGLSADPIARTLAAISAPRGRPIELPEHIPVPSAPDTAPQPARRRRENGGTKGADR